MNIFFTNRDFKLCALDHTCLHSRKMIIEYAQLLSTAHRVLDGRMIYKFSKAGRKQKHWEHPTLDQVLYKATHVNHPSAVWVRESSAHYIWLYNLYAELCERCISYGNKHYKAADLIHVLARLPNNIKDNGWMSDPHLAINIDEYPAVLPYMECDDHTIPYRAYMNEKYKVWRSKPHTRNEVKWFDDTPDWFDSSILNE